MPLVLGGYGRVSANLPADNRHVRPRADDDGFSAAEELPWTFDELLVERSIRAAEVAVARRNATADQHRRVEAMARVSGRAARRRVWTSFDAAETGADVASRAP